VDEQGVRLAMLKIGESYIELLESIQPDSPIEKFMSRRGEAFTISRCESTISKKRWNV